MECAGWCIRAARALPTTPRDQLGVNESVPYARRWLCHYAHSKAIAERAVLAANGESGLLKLRNASPSCLGAR